MKPEVGIIVLAAAISLSFEISWSHNIISSPPILSTTRSSHIPAIFNFGDSNSDTGSWSASFGPILPPNGLTFFGKPSGRASDGRLIIDFIAEKLELPYLGAFLDTIGTDFRHGANFAVSGATIQKSNGKMYDADFNPLSLAIQLSQFEQFKARTAEFYEQAKDDEDVKCMFLPKEDDFLGGLYTMDMGQNDLHYFLVSMTEQQAKESISSVIDQFAVVVELMIQKNPKPLIKMGAWRLTTRWLGSSTDNLKNECTNCAITSRTQQSPTWTSTLLNMIS